MAIVSKTTRCAVCGSTDVTFSEANKRYHCASCGADEAHAMNAADVAAINSIPALGDTEGKLDELRRRGYREEQVEKIGGGNFLRVLRENLS